MRVNNTQTIEIIKDLVEDDTRISIVTIGGDKYYQYQCQVEVDQLKAYTAAVRSADINILSELTNQQFVPVDFPNVTDAQEINQLLRNISQRREQFVQQSKENSKSSLIYSDKIDLFKTLNKVSSLKIASQNLGDMQKSVTRLVSNILSTDTTKAFDQVKNQNQLSPEVSSESLYASLLEQGKDPGKKIVIRSLVEDPSRARKGLGTVVTNEVDKVRSAFSSDGEGEKYTNPTTQNDQIYGVIKETTLNGFLPITFNVPLSNSNLTKNIYLNITITKDDGTIVQSKNFTIDHESYTRKTAIPHVLPTSSFSKIRSNQVMVNVFDKDPIVAGVKIYQRAIKNFNALNNQPDFQEIDTVLTLDDAGHYLKKISLVQQISGKTFFRAVPFLSDGTVLGNYSAASFIEPYEAASGVLYTYFDKQNTVVRLLGTPANFEYIQFLRRSLTRKSKTFLPVGPLINVINGEAEYQDFDIKFEHVYEYSAMLYSTTGTKRQIVASSQIRTTNYASGASLGVNLISSIQTDSGTQNKFNIDISLNKDTDTTLLLESLKSLGIDNYYETEFLKLSADLKKIVKVYVQRIDSKTGEVKVLGFKDIGEFEDTVDTDSVYLFEGVIKSQSDLFEELGSTLTSTKILDARDASQRGDIVSSTLSSRQGINKLNFTQKFLSKKSLIKSTLSVGITRDYQQDDSGFLSGRLGVATAINVNIAEPSVDLDNFVLDIADEQRRILRFDVTQPDAKSIVDFFIIETERGLVRSPVGVAHFIRNQKTQAFFDNITNLRTGTVRYVITPVSFEGTALQSIKTQAFEVL